MTLSGERKKGISSKIFQFKLPATGTLKTGPPADENRKLFIGEHGFCRSSTVDKCQMLVNTSLFWQVSLKEFAL